MLKTRSTRAPKKAPVKNRRVAAPRVKPAHAISLSAADSRKLAEYLSAPAREPNDFMKAALADYQRLLGAK
jgi:uncharacterized protein (DUF1778 family)